MWFWLYLIYVYIQIKPKGRHKKVPKTEGRGHWTDLEHEKFLEGIRLFGKDWRRLKTHIGTRSEAQIRSHAQKYFFKMHKKEGNVICDITGKLINEKRGFMSRSYNLLL